MKFKSKDEWELFLSGNQVIDIEDVPRFEKWSERDSATDISFEIGGIERYTTIEKLREAGRLQE
jgi:hypothetical protein